MIRLLCLLSLVSLASGCGIPNPFAKKKKSNRVEYYVHGDPLILLDNTQQNLTSFLTPENLGLYNGFHLASAASFIEVEVKRPPQPFSEVEAENSTDADEDEIAAAFEMVTYEFAQASATRFEYRPSVDSDYTLGFSLEDGLLKLADINGTAVTIQHYSLKDDGKAFSVLLSYPSRSYGTVLMSLVFADSAVANPVARSDIAYSYLLSDVKLKWEGNISIQGCGPFTDLAKSSVRKSVEAWFQDPSKPADAQTLPAVISFPDTYPPFSDLNSQCVHLVPNFRLENSDSFYTAGVTLPVVNSASKFIFDADILMFISTPVGAQINGEASDTLLHEMGHFLGLGHEFRTDALGNALHPSIMGYSQGAGQITDWDYAAVRDLYGAYLNEVPAL